MPSLAEHAISPAAWHLYVREANSGLKLKLVLLAQLQHNFNISELRMKLPKITMALTIGGFFEVLFFHK